MIFSRGPCQEPEVPHYGPLFTAIDSLKHTHATTIDCLTLGT
jgi:hypothetical protein